MTTYIERTFSGDTMKLLRALHAEPEPDEVVDFTDEAAFLTEAERQLQEAKRPPFWLDEPQDVGTATAAVFGDLDIAEWNAQHADWLDEKRTQEDCRF